MANSAFSEDEQLKIVANIQVINPTVQGTAVTWGETGPPQVTQVGVRKGIAVKESPRSEGVSGGSGGAAADPQPASGSGGAAAAEQ